MKAKPRNNEMKTTTYVMCLKSKNRNKIRRNAVCSMHVHTFIKSTVSSKTFRNGKVSVRGKACFIDCSTVCFMRKLADTRNSPIVPICRIFTERSFTDDTTTVIVYMPRRTNEAISNPLAQMERGIRTSWK